MHADACRRLVQGHLHVDEHVVAILERGLPWSPNRRGGAAPGDDNQLGLIRALSSVRLLEEEGEGGRWGRLGSEALGCWVGAGVGVGAAHPSALPESVAVKEAATPIW